MLARGIFTVAIDGDAASLVNEQYAFGGDSAAARAGGLNPFLGTLDFWA